VVVGVYHPDVPGEQGGAGRGGEGRVDRLSETGSSSAVQPPAGRVNDGGARGQVEPGPGGFRAFIKSQKATWVMNRTK
jgi:hypothetical protein